MLGVKRCGWMRMFNWAAKLVVEFIKRKVKRVSWLGSGCECGGGGKWWSLGGLPVSALCVMR